MGVRRGAVVLAGAAVVAISLGASCSAATTATTWTVHPGGGVLLSMVRMTTLTDTATGSTRACGSVGSGVLKRGSGLSGTGIGSVGPMGYSCAVQAQRLAPRGLPWRLNLSSYDARTGLSRGTISHLQLAFSTHGCRALINGTSGATSDGVVAVTYANRTAKLTILSSGATLHWYHVHDCGHLAANGDPATLSAAYTIGRPQTITSP